MTLSLLFRTDVHLADHNPAAWKGDYTGEVLSCLDQAFDLALANKVEAILDGGDFFHVKAAMRTSHSLVARAIQRHLGSTVPTYGIPGNHDLMHNNLDSVDRQPWGVLVASGAIHYLKDHTFSRDGLTVRVVGLPYDPSRGLDDFRVTRGSEDFLVVVAHALACPNPGTTSDVFGEPVFGYGDLAFEGGPDCYCFGHWHKDQGISKHGTTVFVNQGSLSRGSLSKENLTRVPQVALLDFSPEGLTVKAIPLKVAPSSEVFDLEKKERQEVEDQSIGVFVSRLQQDLVADPDKVTETYLDRMSFARDIRDLAREYLEQAKIRSGG